MIRKTKAGYVMDKVLLPTITRYSLGKADRLILRIAEDSFMRRYCGSCGIKERANYYSVRAFSPDGAKKKLNVWICKECAEKWAPDLQAEADKKSDEAFDETYPEERARMEAEDKATREKEKTEGETIPF